MSTREAGFTLVEIMMAVAVLAVLLVIGFPSFQNTMRYNRVTTSSNDITAAVMMARTQAVGQLQGANICASAEGAVCGTDWSQGWMVWTDKNGNGTMENDEIVNYSKLKDGLEVTVSGGSTGGMIDFDSRGRANATVTISLQPKQCSSSSHDPLRRTLTITPAGQIIKGEAQLCE